MEWFNRISSSMAAAMRRSSSTKMPLNAEVQMVMRYKESPEAPPPGDGAAGF